MTTPLIEVRHLKKYFGKADRPVRALDVESDVIHPGEPLWVVGVSV